MFKYLLILIILIHGLLHLTGFLGAFGYVNFAKLHNEISMSVSVLWLITSVLFVTCAILFQFKKDIWIRFAFIAVGFSQILIFYSWQDARFGSIPNIIILLFAIVGIFKINFKNNYRNEVKIGLAQSKQIPNSILQETDITNLPVQVQKYIRYVGAIGKPIVNNFRIDFVGKIRSHEKPVWMPLVSEQYNFITIPTRLFYLDAVMNYLPVAGFHCFKNG